RLHHLGGDRVHRGACGGGVGAVEAVHRDRVADRAPVGQHGDAGEGGGAAEVAGLAAHQAGRVVGARRVEAVREGAGQSRDRHVEEDLLERGHLAGGDLREDRREQRGRHPVLSGQARAVVDLEGLQRVLGHADLGGELADLRLHGGGGPGRGGVLAAGVGHQVGEQFGGGVVGDQQGVADDLLERRGGDLDGRRLLRRLGRGDLPRDGQAGLAEQLGEAVGGVAGGGGGFGSVLLLVEPALVQGEGGGGGHPAAGRPVVAPRLVAAADEEGVVQRHG